MRVQRQASILQAWFVAVGSFMLLGDEAAAQQLSNLPRQVLELHWSASAKAADLDAPLDAWIAAGTPSFPSPEALDAALRLGHIDTVVVWWEDDASFTLPLEPRCTDGGRILDRVGRGEATVRPLARLEEWLAGRSARLALGRAREAPAPAMRRVQWEDDARTVSLVRALRPGGTDLWCDPRFARDVLRSRFDAGWSLSVRSRTPSPDGRDALQTLFDAAAFGGAGRDQPPLRLVTHVVRTASEVLSWSPDDPAAFAAHLWAQSRLISALAAPVGGADCDRLDVLRNRVTVGPSGRVRGIAPLRDDVASLRLIELLCSPSIAPSVASLADHARHADRWTAPTVPTASLSAHDELIDPAHLEALGAGLAFRWEAARRLGRLLVHADESERARSVEALNASARRLDSLPSARHPDLPALADERQFVERVAPLRATRRSWTLAEASGRGTHLIATIDTVHAHDGRWGHRAGWLVQSVAETEIRLGDWVGETRHRTWVLSTSIPSAEARNARLSFQGECLLDAQLNDASLVQGYDASPSGAGPLRETISLAPGRNRLTLLLTPSLALGSVNAQITALPRPYEGVHLSAARARLVREPMVQIEHPAALQEQVLVIPERARSTDAVSGVAEFTFDPPQARRVDLWLRALAPARGTGEVEVSLDGEVIGSLFVPPGAGWTWVSLDAPLWAEAGVRTLRLRVRERGLMIDTVTLLETGTVLPRQPDGDGALQDTLWRFDPLGRGQRLDLSGLSRTRDDVRRFTPNRSGTAEVFVWLDGLAPLRSGQRSELELTTVARVRRFTLPEGTPVEEWVSVGSLQVQEGEPISVRARGDGDPLYVCFR